MTTASDEKSRLDLAAVREKLAREKGPTYWRSLEELAGSADFQQLMRDEFPRFASVWPDGLSRRGFLEISAASLALAGLTGCTRQPTETIVPYVRMPEELVPGRPLYYATAMEVAGHALGLLAEAHLGRPTKLEGNPEHPASLGSTDVYAQASILGLYDPDRSQHIRYLDRHSSTWSAFLGDLRNRLGELEGKGGDGLRFLTGTVCSPSLAAQIEKVLARFPGARWHQYEPAGRHSARAAAQAAFGTHADTRYDLSKASVIVALDSDFLTSGSGWTRYARDFSRRRKALREGKADAANRLYCVESSPTATAAQADHRLGLAPAGVSAVAAALAAALGVPGASPVDLSRVDHGAAAAAWVAAAAADLRAHRGAGVVIAGECATEDLHVLAHAINEALGNVGSTVFHTEPIEARPEDQFASLRSLTEAMRAGKVDTLLIFGVNPVYDAPAELEFGEAMKSVTRRAHLSLYADETTRYCDWHVPMAHYLESWGDARAFDGTVSPVQPLLEPLYDGKTPHDLLALFGETSDATTLEVVRAHWQEKLLAGANGSFESMWRKALHDGVLPGTEAPVKSVVVRAEAVAKACSDAAQGASADGLALIFRPCPGVYDGRFANNGWLQELPKPISRLAWDNALLLSPADAERLGLSTQDMARVTVDGRSLEVAVYVLPGQPKGGATLHLGYGRSHAGRVGSGVGFNAYALRTSAHPWVAPAAQVERIDGSYRLATVQEHREIELQTKEAGTRHLVRHGTVGELQHNPGFVAEMGHHPPGPTETMHPLRAYDGPYSWGVAIDLSSCVGCNACVTACVSENNIPVVGKDQVLRGREMHWIRLDRYYQGDLDDPGVHHQPVMCMHCEQAPCEIVCPVGATVHNDEGLNDMVYNRCVGTRYCSNNCPYKVRRFNFLLYNDFETEVLKMGRNPDVTVRSRGVMEKCSYCVQRINVARIDAKREGRLIKDGEIQTACQQACPAEAIVFGNLNDEASEVNRWKASPLNYALIGELGTRPRTTYLAKISNPSPALAGAGGHSSAPAESAAPSGEHGA